MEGQSLFIGWRSCGQNAYCPTCGGPVDAKNVLAFFRLIDVPRVLCDACGRAESPSLAECLDVLRRPNSRARDLVEGRPDESGLTVIREFAATLEECVAEDVSPSEIIEVDVDRPPPPRWGQPPS